MKKPVSKIAILGPLTKDRVVIHNRPEYISAGGAVFYCGEALVKLGVDTTIFITIAEKDLWLTEQFSKKAVLKPIYKEETAYFENLYPRRNVDYRIQKAKLVYNPFLVKELEKVNFNEYQYLILGSLQNSDFPLETITFLAKFKTKLCFAIQGFLRRIENENVLLREFEQKESFLRHAHLVLMNEMEAQAFMPYTSFEDICRKTAKLGPEEVIITKGSKGSLIYLKKRDQFFSIPAFVTSNIKDATGAGDNYLAGYLLKRTETDNIQEAGEFAAMTATLKLEREGAFNKSRTEVEQRLKIHRLLKAEELAKIKTLNIF